MNKKDLIKAILEKTTAHKKSHLDAMKKEDLEAIYTELTSDVKINTNEKLLLATIPHCSDYADTASVMDGRNFLKKAEEINGVPLKKGCRLFGVLRDKGFYTAKARESGQKRTTFQLTSKGIRYLADHGLLAVV